MPYSVKGFFEINEDMVEILLMLDVLFTQDFKVENLFCGAFSALNPACSSAIISSAWGLKVGSCSFESIIILLIYFLNCR